MCLKTVQ
jgi:glutathione S-transferase